MAAVSVAMGQGSASFWVKVTLAGRPQLRAVPDAWPSVQRDLDIDAGAPTAIAIASPPQVITAGMCSQPVVVQAQDAYGNPSPVASSVALTPDFGTAMGVTLHDDGTCGTPLVSLSIPAGQPQAQLFFSAPSAVMLTLTVDAGTLGTAAQAEEVQ
jgi:hypothetical protein